MEDVIDSNGNNDSDDNAAVSSFDRINCSYGPTTSHETPVLGSLGTILDQ